MRRRILTAICAALVIWGGVFVGLTNALDEESEPDW